jgi:protein SCO1/2
MIRELLPVVLVVTLGAAVLYKGTDGFQAFTNEQARRLAVARTPISPPQVLLEDQEGQRFTLSEYRGKVVLVDFVYTHCLSLCRVAGAQVGAIARMLMSAGMKSDVMVVTISFDPLRDSPAVLRAHAVKLGADPASWRFARPVDPGQLPPLLRAFGVIAVPDGTGEFQHNGAVHLLARDGRLAAIYDYEHAEQIMRDISGRT